jgi:UDP-N-acetyl-2-amino-2-deoxyglucuronate dehydrogenase
VTPRRQCLYEPWELVDRGRLGRLILGDAVTKWYRSQGYYDSGDWRGTWALDGGGALMNQGVHYLDLLCWIMGPVDQVTALCATQTHTIEVEDVALALLRFRPGAVGLLQATTAAYPGFSGTVGDLRDRRLGHRRGGRHPVTGAARRKGDVGAYGGKASPVPPAAATAAANPGAVADEAHRAQLADFLAALDSGGQPLVTGDEARADVAVIRAAYDSARSGRPVAPEERPG